MATIRLPQHLEQVQRELASKLAEADRIGECLATLGSRLQQEPWKWAIDWLEDAFPPQAIPARSSASLSTPSTGTGSSGC